MDFSLDEAQQEIRDLARRILDARSPTTPDSGYPAPWPDRTTWGDLATAGLIGIGLPEEVGGSGLGLTATALVLEEVGRAAGCIPAWATITAADAIGRLGSAEQRQRFLPPVAEGATFLSVALVEAGEADPRKPRTTATPDGEGYRLDGEKYAVPTAGIAERVLVSAVRGDGSPVLALVDPTAVGVTLEPIETTHGEPQFALRLDGAVVPAEDILAGVTRDGAAALDEVLQRASLGIAAMELGVAEKALDMTAAYVSQREQFGRPIGTFQAVAVRCANAYIDVQAMRTTLQQALWRIDEGLPAREEVAVAKFWAAEGGERVLSSAVHLHGGIGVDTDYPLHHYFLWSKHLELCLGGATWQLVDLGDVRAESVTA
jgi:3-oxocholest-4-en-26-oyl-CoA dehydrogenase beta subunit